MQDLPVDPVFTASTRPAHVGGRCYALLDTNIFVHALPFVDNLLQGHYDAVGCQFVLCIAKVVMHELDQLKKNGAVKDKANMALDLIRMFGADRPSQSKMGNLVGGRVMCFVTDCSFTSSRTRTTRSICDASGGDRMTTTSSNGR